MDTSKLPHIGWITDRIYKALFGYDTKTLLATAKMSTLYPKEETDIHEAIRDCMNEKALDALAQMEESLAIYFKTTKAIGFSEIFTVIQVSARQIRGQWFMMDIWADNDNIEWM